MIDGEYLNLTEAKSLELKWRFKDWGDAGYSHVLITFEEDEEDVSASSDYDIAGGLRDCEANENPRVRHVRQACAPGQLGERLALERV